MWDESSVPPSPLFPVRCQLHAGRQTHVVVVMIGVVEVGVEVLPTGENKGKQNHHPTHNHTSETPKGLRCTAAGLGEDFAPLVLPGWVPCPEPVPALVPEKLL